jgi:hypothetical protein
MWSMVRAVPVVGACLEVPRDLALDVARRRHDRLGPGQVDQQRAERVEPAGQGCVVDVAEPHHVPDRAHAEGFEDLAAQVGRAPLAHGIDVPSGGRAQDRIDVVADRARPEARVQRAAGLEMLLPGERHDVRLAVDAVVNLPRGTEDRVTVAGLVAEVPRRDPQPPGLRHPADRRRAPHLRVSRIGIRFQLAHGDVDDDVRRDPGHS